MEEDLIQIEDDEDIEEDDEDKEGWEIEDDED